MSVEWAIATEGLEKLYRTAGSPPVQALKGIDLRVAQGRVTGFLGPNGAGKTTAIRCVMDFIRPTAGRCLVLGQDVAGAGPALRRRIGYLAGDFVVPETETVESVLRFLAGLRGGVDSTRLRSLCDRLELAQKPLVRSLSKGNRQKIGLVQAFMHAPELLILDEPTSGLDPLLQREFHTMVREACTQGHTVFMSSHVLSEVRAVAEQVVIVRRGDVVEDVAMHNLTLSRTRRITVQFKSPVSAEDFESLPGVEHVVVDGQRLSATVSDGFDALIKRLSGHEVELLDAHEPDLEDLFLRYYDARAGSDGQRTPSVDGAQKAHALEEQP